MAKESEKKFIGWLSLAISFAISSGAAFAQSGDPKFGVPVNLGHVHKSYADSGSGSNPGSNTTPTSQPYLSPAPAANPSTYIPPATNAAASTYSAPAPAPVSPVTESVPAKQSSGKVHKALHNLGNVIRKDGSALLNSPSVQPMVNRTGYSSAPDNPQVSENKEVVPGAYNPANNFTSMPAVPRRAPKNTNPNGSLSFSSPIKSRGPYNDAGATALYRAQNYSALLDYARGYTAASPKSGFAWFALGEGAYKTGNYDAAVEGFRRATQYVPTEPKAWNGLSAAYCKREQWDFAIKAVTDGESAASGHFSASDWYVFGNAFKNLQQYDHAAQDYRKALAMRPNFPEAQNNLATIMQMNGDEQTANQLYKKSAAGGNKLARQNSNNLEAAQREAAAAAQRSSRSHPVDFGQMEFRRQTYQNAHPDTPYKSSSY